MSERPIIKINIAQKQTTKTFARKWAMVGFMFAYVISTLVGGFVYNIPAAQAAIPKYINFQGKLTIATAGVNQGSNVADGTYAFQFKLYDAASAGTLLWTETYDQAPTNACQKIQVTNGVFNTKLGSCNSLAGVDFTGGSLYLTVNFAPTGTSYDGEMSPRKQLVSSAFAFVANGVSGDGVVNNAVQSATALTTGRTNANPAFQVDTNTASSVTGLKVTSAAAAGGLALAVISSGTNENLTLDAKGSGTVTINGTATGNVAVGGTSAGAKLQVNGTADATVGMFINGTAGQSANLLNIGKNGNGAYFQIDKDGKIVAINGQGATISASGGNVYFPSGTIIIDQLQGSTGNNYLKNNGTTGVLYTSNSSADGIQVGHIFNTANTLIAGNKIASFKNNGTEKLSIDYNGNLTANGITAPGTINFGGLSASSAVYTDGSKNLTSTAPTSGTIGYWSRSGTTLQPTTANDILSIPTTNTTGADLAVTNTGAYTGTGILNVTANSATTGTLGLITSSSLTSGNLLSLTSNGTGALTNQTGLNISLQGTNATSAQTTYGAQISNTHAGTTSTNVGLNVTVANGTTANYAALFNGGNVGIGTSTPAAALELLKTTEQLRLSYDASNYTSFTVASNGGLAVSPIGGGVVTINNTSNGSGLVLNGTVAQGIQLQQSGSTKLTIGVTKNAGDYITGTSASDAAIRTANQNIFFSTDNGTTANVVIKSTGSVGINTSSPSQKLEVSQGNIKAVGVQAPTSFSGTATTGGSLANANYYYAITGVDATGESSPVYTYVNVTGANNQVNLSWTASPLATSYNIYRSTNPQGTFVKYNTASTSYSDTGAAGSAATPPLSGTAKGLVQSNSGININDSNGTALINSTGYAGGYANTSRVNIMGGYFSFGTTGQDGGNGAYLATYGGLAIADTANVAASLSFKSYTGDVQGFNLNPRNGTINLQDAGGTNRFYVNAGVADGASAVGYTLDTTNSLSNATAKLLAVRNQSSEKFTILAGGNVGINTTGPDRKLDVLDASNPQLRLTYTDGSVYSDLQTNSSGNLVVSNTGGKFLGPNGSVIAGNGPGIAFASYPNDGIASNGSNLALWQSGVIALNLADSLKEFRVPSDYKFAFSSATNNNSSSDTSFYRSSAGVLRTGGSFTVDGGLTVGTGYIQSAGTMSLTSANTTAVTTASAFAVNINSLTTGTGEYIASSSLTSGKLLDIQSSGTGALTGQTGLNIAIQGTNSTAAQTTYGAQISNTHAGTTSTNVGLNVAVANGTTNYAALFAGGNVGIGINAPTSLLSIVGSAPTGFDHLEIGDAGAVDGTPSTKILFRGYGVDHGGLIFTPSLTGANEKIQFTHGGSSDVNSQTVLMTLLGNGNVGIGDTTPAAALTVGSGDLFQVNSSGAIAAATGITSSGTINFSGLSASSAVYTDGSKNLTSTAPTSGAIGYWSRSGTTLQPTTANDILSIPTTNTTGADLAVTNTGAYTGTGILNVTANSATTGTLGLITSSSLTSGNLLNLTSNGTGALTGQTGLNIALQGTNATSAQTTYGAQISNTHAGTTSTNVGLNVTVANGTTANYAALFNGGNVGIGTSTPAAALHVLSTSQQLKLSYDATYRTDFTTDTTGFKIASNGSPITLDTSTAKFIFPTSGETIKIQSGSSPYVGFFNNTPTRVGWFGFGYGFSNLEFSNEASGSLVFRTGSNVARLTIDSSGDSYFTGEVQVTKTTEQLRLNYDASNYMSTTIGSTGSATLALTGTTPTFNFSNDAVITTADLSSSSTAQLSLASTNTHYGPSMKFFYNTSTDTGFRFGTAYHTEQIFMGSSNTSSLVSLGYLTGASNSKFSVQAYPYQSGGASATISPYATDSVGLKIQLAASATADAIQVYDSTPTKTFSVSSSGAIKTSTLTSGRITYAGTGGLLQDSANLTYDGNVNIGGGGAGAYTEFRATNNGGTSGDRVAFGVGGTATGDIYQNRAYFLGGANLSGLLFQAAGGDMKFYGGGSSPWMQLSAGNQKLYYDASNYLTTTVGSTGSTTFALTGTSPTFTFSQAATFSGNITNTVLSASSAVYTDGSKNLTSSAPTSGAIGYLSRSGTTLQPTTANDVLSIPTANTTGADLAITNTGAYTGTGILNLTANSATTGTLGLINSSSVTSGKLLNLTSNGTGALTGQTGLNIALQGTNGTSAQTTYGAQISNTHAGTTSTNVGLSVSVSGGTTANYSALFNGGNVGIGTTTPTAGLYLIAPNISTVGAVFQSASGNISSNIAEFRTGAGSLVSNVDVNGWLHTSRTYADEIYGSTTTLNVYSLNSLNFNSSAKLVQNSVNAYDIGVYTGSGSTRNFLFRDDGGVNIGTQATSTGKLHVLSTTEQLRLGYDASNYLSATVGSTGSTTLDLTGTSPLFTFGKAIIVPNGTAALPAISFASGNTDGFYRAAANSIGISIGANAAERIDTSGHFFGQNRPIYFTSGDPYSVAATAGVNLASAGVLKINNASTGFGSLYTGDLRVNYDTTNYLAATVSSAGAATLQPTGSVINLGGGTTQTALRFLEASANGSNYVAFKAPSSLAGDVTWTLPTADATGCLQSNGSGTLSIASCGGSVPLSSLIAATGTNSINNADYAQTWSWDSLTSNTGLTLSSSSTAAASNTQTILKVATSGANATSTQTTYGAQFTNTHTGTSSTNIAAYFTASGGSNNYAAIFNGGNVGIGDTTPAALFTVGTSDAFQVNSSGLLTIANDINIIGGPRTIDNYDGTLTLSSSYWGTTINLDDNVATFNTDIETTGIRLASAHTTQVTTGSAVVLTANSLTTGTGQYIASSSLTSGKLLDIQSNGTAALTGQTGLNIALQGANASSTQTTYGAQISNTHTGTSSTNVGLSVTASGGTTNYAALFNGGNVGIGTTTPAQKLQVTDGSQLINTTSSFTPTTLSSGFEAGAYNVNSTVVAGRYLYMGKDGSDTSTCSGTTLTGCELAIFDISVPNTVTAVSGVNVGASVKAIAVKGEYIYYGSGAQVYVYRFTGSGAPAYVSTFGTSGNVTTLAINGNNLLVGTDGGSATLYLYSISIPSAPSFTSSLSSGSPINSVVAKDDYIYVGLNAVAGTCSGGTATGCEFRIYSYAGLSFVKGVDITINVNSIDVVGRYAYLGLASASGNDFRIYDVNDPANNTPSTTGGLDVSTSVLSVKASGNTVYAGLASVSGNDFRVFNVSDSTNPIDGGGIDTGVDVRSIGISGVNAIIGMAQGTGNDLKVIYYSAGVDTPRLTVDNGVIANLQVTQNGNFINGLTSSSLLVGSGGIYSSGTISASVLNLTTQDYGNTVNGPILTVGYNNHSGTEAPGMINILNKSGTAGYVWQDNGGNLCMDTTQPTYSSTSCTTVVGDQTSTRSTKQDIADFSDLAGALQKVTSAPLHTFRYIKDVNGYGTDSPLAKTRIGFIADEVPGDFMWGNFIDQVSVNGLLMGSVQQLNKITVQYASNGNVGIGLPEGQLASEKLVVNGNAIIEGNLVTQGTVTAHEFVTDGNADVAEKYTSNDTTLTAGELVSIDPTANSKVKRASINESIIGVVSTAPGLTLGGSINNNSATPNVPVALAGRVPVKVSPENGPIIAGDFLTASATIPGAAMKATKAGTIIGQALESYSGTEVGKVMVFVKATNYNGLAMEKQMEGLTFDFTSETAVVDSTDEILAKLMAQLPNLNSDNLSQVNTDVVIANGAVVTPHVTTNALRTDFLSAVAADGGLKVASTTIFNGGLQVDHIKSITDLISFNSDVEFFGTPYFTTDTAGFAVVKAGVQTVDVKFTREYLAQPIVNASYSFEQNTDTSTVTDPQALAALQAAQVAQAQTFLAEGVTFAITNKTKNGFTIVLNKPATTDVKFSWTAFAVRNATTFMSLDAPTAPAAQASTTSNSSANGSGTGDTTTSTTTSTVPATTDTSSQTSSAPTDNSQPAT